MNHRVRNRLIFSVFLISFLAIVVYTILLFVPKNHGQAYRLKVNKGQGMSAVSRNLANDGAIFSRWVLMSAAWATGTHHKLVGGSYRFPERFSTWDVVKRLQQNNPDTVRVQIIEGMTFAQMRRVVNQTEGIRHDSRTLSDGDLLQKVAPDAPSTHPEGLFFPDSYELDAESSDMQVFQAAYKAMERELAAAWADRAANLPYARPYDLLIMASLIEKETGHEDDRRDVAAVFRNRLAMDMPLQTDPTVIYGMGSAYQGKIRRSDLRRDTPYNTYTRKGLTPTPIALPSRAALAAAANPSDARYVYFVSRMDGTGRSAFSHTLDEHNAAVRKFILKK